MHGTSVNKANFAKLCFADMAERANIEASKAENFGVNKAIVQKNEAYKILRSQVPRFVGFNNKEKIWIKKAKKVC